jgi:hypothetical protein
VISGPCHGRFTHPASDAPTGTRLCRVPVERCQCRPCC